MGPHDDRSALPRPATATELKDVMAIERAGTPFLLYRDAERVLQAFVLSGDAVAIGRGAGPDVRLDFDETVSGVHAELSALGGHWAIADDGLSRNGTLVNNQPLRGRQRLRGGDVIRLGQTTLVFHDASADMPSATAIPDDRGGPVHVTDAQHRVLVALCRPYRERGGFVTPATNQAIADELVVSVEAVKTQLRVLYQRVGIDHLPQNEKRARLAERALELGLVAVNEL